MTCEKGNDPEENYRTERRIQRRKEVKRRVLSSGNWFFTSVRNLVRIQTGETLKGICVLIVGFDLKCVEGRDDTTRTSACKVLLK